MNIEHWVFLSWVHERHGDPTHKNHAQDCETLCAVRHQRPAILPWSSCPEWLHPSGGFGPKHLGFQILLSTRATGTVPVIVQSPECGWAKRTGERDPPALWLGTILSGKPEIEFPDRAHSDARSCARWISDECCAFRAAPCSAPRPSS
jgi:hypothetical protein